MFKQYEILHGLPKEGQKIVYKNPTKFALQRCVVDNEALLTIGETYTVKKVNLNSSSTYVYLQEFHDDTLDEYRATQKFFSMHAFEWEKPKIEPSDLVGFTARDLRTLNRVYGYDVILYSDHVDVMTEPPIICNIDENQFIVSAKYEDFFTFKDGN